jgi:hypothetical protein
MTNLETTMITAQILYKYIIQNMFNVWFVPNQYQYLLSNWYLNIYYLQLCLYLSVQLQITISTIETTMHLTIVTWINNSVTYDYLKIVAHM